MNNAQWFRCNYDIVTSRGIHRLERRFGKHQALSMWVRMLIYLYQNDNRCDWADEDDRIDVCEALCVDEDTAQTFFTILAKIDWIDGNLWKASSIISSVGVAKQIKDTKKLSKKRSEAVKKRWENQTKSKG